MGSKSWTLSSRGMSNSPEQDANIPYFARVSKILIKVKLSAFIVFGPSSWNLLRVWYLSFHCRKINCGDTTYFTKFVKELNLIGSFDVCRWIWELPTAWIARVPHLERPASQRSMCEVEWMSSSSQRKCFEVVAFYWIIMVHSHCPRTRPRQIPIPITKKLVKVLCCHLSLCYVNTSTQYTRPNFFSVSISV